MAKRKQSKPAKAPSMRKSKPPAVAGSLLNEVRVLIHETRAGVAQAVNVALVMLYWRIGDRIRNDILQSQRAGYGDEIVVTLSRQLATEFGSGYSKPNLTRMMRFSDLFPERKLFRHCRNNWAGAISSS